MNGYSAVVLAFLQKEIASVSSCLFSFFTEPLQHNSCLEAKNFLLKGMGSVLEDGITVKWEAHNSFYYFRCISKADKSDIACSEKCIFSLVRNTVYIFSL